MFHVIVVAVVKTIGQIAVLVVEGRRYFLKLLVGHLRIQTVNLHLQSDEAVLGIKGITHRLLDGFDASTRGTEHNGVFSFWLLAVSFWHGQIAIDAVATVDLQLQQIAVELIGRILVHLFAFH